MQFEHSSIGSLRYVAEMAGLGIVRKNNFLYSEKGSYLELVGYVIDQECELYHESIEMCFIYEYFWKRNIIARHKRRTDEGMDNWL